MDCDDDEEEGDGLGWHGRAGISFGGDGAKPVECTKRGRERRKGPQANANEGERRAGEPHMNRNKTIVSKVA